MYNIKSNPEFSELIHLCLLAFDKVADFYRDQMFEEVLIQPILSLALKFVDLLNQVPNDQDNKYN